MDQVNQTNNLQQAIDEAANKDQFGIPPMPPMEGEGVPSAAPFTTEPTMPEVATPAAGPSAEQILSDSLAEAPAGTPASTEAAETPVEAPATEVPADNPAPAETQPEGDLASIRESVIKDLLPLMDKVDSTPEEKFEIYKDAMKTMHDAKTIEGAYRTATQFSDEAKKADALMGLMKTIDNA